MKAVWICVVLFSYIYQCSLAEEDWESDEAYGNNDDFVSTTLDPKVVRMETDLENLYNLAKQNIKNAANDNETTADIVRRIIYTNATGLLHNLPESCPPLADAHGVHMLKVGNHASFSVFCDAKLDGPGWTVIQRRLDGSVNFFRNWTMYKNGFGNISEEFFIGLDKLHAITASRPHELYIYLEDFDGNSKYARYDEFLILNEDCAYKLSKLGAYSGNAGNSLVQHLNSKFSTYDNDNDDLSSNCARQSLGAWWYKADSYCAYSSLNGIYLDGEVPDGFSEKGIYWHHWRKDMYSYKTTQMMIRPKCLQLY